MATTTPKPHEGTLRADQLIAGDFIQFNEGSRYKYRVHNAAVSRNGLSVMLMLTHGREQKPVPVTIGSDKVFIARKRNRVISAKGTETVLQRLERENKALRKRLDTLPGTQMSIPLISGPMLNIPAALHEMEAAADGTPDRYVIDERAIDRFVENIARDIIAKSLTRLTT